MNRNLMQAMEIVSDAMKGQPLPVWLILFDTYKYLASQLEGKNLSYSV